MKKQSFVLSAIILALGGFFAKGIGALYKIPLANVLGSSGMGLYYLVFPIYSLIITICSSGISVALATEVAKCRKKRQKYNEHKLLRVALVSSFCLSLVFTIVVCIFAKPISEWQGNINAYMGYIAIAPAIIISSIIATIRGYFQGIQNMIPTTVSMIIEQIVKLSIGLILAHNLSFYGIQFAVLGAILGVTISEVVALVMIVINFFAYKGQLHYNYKNLSYKPKKKNIPTCIIKNDKHLIANKLLNRKIYNTNPNNYKYLTKDAIKLLFKVFLPTTLSSLVIPIATMLDSFVVINILCKIGYSSYVSTSLYGMFGGVVQSLISLPTIIIAAISTSLIPSLSGLIVHNDTNEIKYRVSFFIKITWILSIIIFIIMFVFSEDILMFLYGDALDNHIIDEMYYATKMLKISSVSIIYYAFLQTFTAIFQSIGKSSVPFWSLFIGLIVRTILVFGLVSMVNINIFGVIIANIVFLSIATILMAYSIKGYIELEYVFLKHLLSPLLIGGVVLIGCMLLRMALKGLMNYFLAMIITSIVGIIVYLIYVYFSNVFTKKERKYLNIFRKRGLK